MEKPFDSLSKRISVAETLVGYLAKNRTGIVSRSRNLDSVGESTVGRKMEVEHLRKSLEKQLNDLEKREKEFDAFKEGEKRKLASEEEKLSFKRQKLLDDVKMRVEVLDEHLASVKEHVEWFRMAKAGVQSIHQLALQNMKEIESQELNLRAAQESLAERERKVRGIVGTLDERISVIEEREEKFTFFVEGKMGEIVLEEVQFHLEREAFVEQVKLAEAKFRKQEKLNDAVIEKLELADNKLESVRTNVDERFKEIELCMNAAWESVAVSVMEADSIREMMEKEVEEFVKMRSEFSSFQKDKMRELDSREQLLNKMSEELVKHAKFRNEELVNRETLVNRLLKKLNLAKGNVEELKRVVDERFRSITLKEIELNSISDWVEKKIDELDHKERELEKKEERIRIKEDNVMHKENELKEKENELSLKEKRLLAWQEDLEVKQEEVESMQQSNEQQLRKLDARDKSLNSVKACVNSCFKEHLAIKRKLLFEKDLVEKTARFLGLKEVTLENAVRALEFREKQLSGHVEGHELEQQGSMEADESVELKFTVKMDGKNLQMFLNDPEKDLESMGDEIFKVLHLSSDPAKLVLDALEGFYPPHLRKGDVTFNVRRTCITLLKNLIKISKKIKPHVRKEAMELATAWMSEMKATAGNTYSLEVLGFLFLLAAYNLASCFDTDEISRLLKTVAQHRETPELYRILGFSGSTTGERRIADQCITLVSS